MILKYSKMLHINVYDHLYWFPKDLLALYGDLLYASVFKSSTMNIL